jgi:hypothetical protein
MLGRRKRLPPDPTAIQGRRQKQTAASQREQDRRIEQILNRINKALASAHSYSKHVGSIAITGSDGKARIYETSGTTHWVGPLLASLRGPAYREYSVTACVQWRDPKAGTFANRKQAPLDENNPAGSVREARRHVNVDRTPVYVCVTVQMRRKLR